MHSEANNDIQETTSTLHSLLQIRASAAELNGDHGQVP